jgi:hypothetical protein
MRTLAEFTAKDTAWQTDQERYAAMTAAFEADLRPLGMLEISFAAEILRATWQMQFLPRNLMELTPPTAAHYTRVRTGIQATIRWAMTELRRIQTARVLRGEIGLPNTVGIADPKEIVKATRRAPQPPASTAAHKTPTPPTSTKPNPAAVSEMETFIESMFEKLDREDMAAMMNERTVPGATGPAFATPAGQRAAA